MGLLTGVWVRGYSQKHRIRNDSKTAASARFTPVWVTAHTAGKLEHTAQPAGSSTG